ncbi:MAG: hypothetical protein A2039_05160 [Candidatus Melainabacteria bacterium GWA2_34_9]|nr:MAG: hypothetical protein A2039_05160 [Candidatus Melainabacteria bacterium GWA2_34_9]
MAIYEKNSRWYLKLQIRGKRYHQAIPEATNRRDAEKAETILKAELLQGKYNLIDNKGEKLIDIAFELFKKKGAATRKGWKNDKSTVATLENFFNGKKFKEISPFTVEKYRIFRQGQGLKPASINRDITILSGVFNIAIDERLTDVNPCRGVKPLRVDNYREKFLSVDDEHKLIKACTDYFAYLKPVLTTLLHTGMRKNEVLKMKWTSVDLKKEVFTLYDTKNGKPRKVDMSPTLVKIFEGIKVNSCSEYVFVNPKTGMPYYDIQHALKKLCNRAEVPYLNPHGLRHTSATRMVASGDDLVVVADILGHSDIRITASRYAHPMEANKKRAIHNLEAFSQKKQA